MHGTIADAAEIANLGSATSVPRSERSGHLQRALGNCVRKIFHGKILVELTDLLGISERTAKHRLGGTRHFKAEDVAELLRTEEGLAILAVMMGEARPKWWVRLQQQMAIADARAFERAARRKLEEARHAGESLAAAIEDGEATAMLRGEGLHRAAAELDRHRHRAPVSASGLARGSLAPAAPQAAR